MYQIFFVVGMLSILYFIMIAFGIEHSSKFCYIWLFIGAVLIAFALLNEWDIYNVWIPAFLRKTIEGVVFFGITLFIIVEGCILSFFWKKGKSDADYMIVLGAQMKEKGPSKALQYRLDKAITYLEKNEKTMVIVSGGQGKNEPVSEAYGMYRYLIENGILPKRIIKEEESRNTFQNLYFSTKFLEKDKHCVVVVSNNFHIFRAIRIAKKMGYKKVYGLAAKGEPLLQANNMMREFFAVVKDFSIRNI